MSFPALRTLLKYHVYIFGQAEQGNANQSSALPLLCDGTGVLLTSPATSGGNTVAILQPNADDVPVTTFALAEEAFNLGYNATEGGWDRMQLGPANADGLAPSAIGNNLDIAQMFGWNGASFDRVRLANVYKTVLATASGVTAVWTPAAGKKFRLMGYTISVAGTAAATSVQLMKLFDNSIGALIAQHQATVAITTPTGDTQIGADLGQGYLASAVNNVLNINLSEAMATGAVCVNAWGTEE